MECRTTPAAEPGPRGGRMSVITHDGAYRLRFGTAQGDNQAGEVLHGGAVAPFHADLASEAEIVEAPDARPR